MATPRALGLPPLPKTPVHVNAKRFRSLNCGLSSREFQTKRGGSNEDQTLSNTRADVRPPAVPVSTEVTPLPTLTPLWTSENDIVRPSLVERFTALSWESERDSTPASQTYYSENDTEDELFDNTFSSIPMWNSEMDSNTASKLYEDSRRRSVLSAYSGFLPESSSSPPNIENSRRDLPCTHSELDGTHAARLSGESRRLSAPPTISTRRLRAQERWKRARKAWKGAAGSLIPDFVWASEAEQAPTSKKIDPGLHDSTSDIRNSGSRLDVNGKFVVACTDGSTLDEMTVDDVVKALGGNLEPTEHQRAEALRIERDIHVQNLSGADAFKYILVLKFGSLGEAFAWLNFHKSERVSRVAFDTGMLLLHVDIEKLTGMSKQQIFASMDSDRSFTISKHGWHAFFDAPLNKAHACTNSIPSHEAIDTMVAKQPQINSSSTGFEPAPEHRKYQLWKEVIAGEAERTIPAEEEGAVYAGDDEFQRGISYKVLTEAPSIPSADESHLWIDGYAAESQPSKLGINVGKTSKEEGGLPTVSVERTSAGDMRFRNPVDRSSGHQPDLEPNPGCLQVCRGDIVPRQSKGSCTWPGQAECITGVATQPPAEDSMAVLSSVDHVAVRPRYASLPSEHVDEEQQIRDCFLKYAGRGILRRSDLLTFAKDARFVAQTWASMSQTASDTMSSQKRRRSRVNGLVEKVESIFDDTLELQADLCRQSRGLTMDYFKVFLGKVATLLGWSLASFLSTLASDPQE